MSNGTDGEYQRPPGRRHPSAGAEGRVRAAETIVAAWDRHALKTNPRQLGHDDSVSLPVAFAGTAPAQSNHDGLS
jgi:hypothetical protein